MEKEISNILDKKENPFSMIYKYHNLKFSKIYGYTDSSVYDHKEERFTRLIKDIKGQIIKVITIGPSTVKLSTIGHSQEKAGVGYLIYIEYKIPHTNKKMTDTFCKMYNGSANAYYNEIVDILKKLMTVNTEEIPLMMFDRKLEKSILLKILEDRLSGDLKKIDEKDIKETEIQELEKPLYYDCV